jgi:hypothetical protein
VCDHLHLVGQQNAANMNEKLRRAAKENVESFYLKPACELRAASSKNPRKKNHARLTPEGQGGGLRACIDLGST